MAASPHSIVVKTAQNNAAQFRIEEASMQTGMRKECQSQPENALFMASLPYI
jgi:hypothetical protein